MYFAQFIAVLIMVFGLVACQSNDSDLAENQQKVLVKASGLTNPVELNENINNSSHTISQDGNHELVINKGIYRFELADTAGQHCRLNHELELTCEELACPDVYEPVCGKEHFVNVCIDSPCTTDVYKTFSNSCSLNVANAWYALPGECENLENVAALHTKPVSLVPIALINYHTDPFELISSEITADTLTIVTQVGGGCGTHDVTVYVDNIISLPDSDPPQIAIGISHHDFDDCEALVRVSSAFDLLPVKENYRRLFPNASGVIRVRLNELGIYEFEL